MGQRSGVAVSCVYVTDMARILHCCGVAQASSYTSNSTPSLGASISQGADLNERNHKGVGGILTKSYLKVCCCCFVFLGPHLQLMDVPRLGVELEL